MPIRPILPAIALAACSGEKPAATGDDSHGDTLVIAALADADVLLDVVAQSSGDSMIIDNLQYPLLDNDFSCELQWKPALAKSWERSEDGKTIRMELRDDITWSDGQKVTTDDIAFSMDLIADPVVASPRIDYIERIQPDARPRVVDPTHIEWEFTECYDYNTQLANASAVAFAPKHALADADRASLRGHEIATKPLVTGRWKVAAWDRQQRIVLEPNEKWTGPADQKPKLERVIFRVLPEYATRLVELETGGVDLMESIQVADADRLAKEHPEIKLHRRGWRSMDYVAWNLIDSDDYAARKKVAEAAYEAASGECDGKPAGPEQEACKAEARKLVLVDPSKVKPHRIFGDPGVRKALAKAVDVDKLIGDLLTSKVTGEVYGRPSIGTVTPALCNVHNDALKQLPYDPEGAKAELDALGWKDTDGDGVRDKDGVPFRFVLETNSGNARRNQGAIVIQAMLKDVGVDAQIQQFETNTFFDRHRKKQFDASYSGWSAALFLDPTSMWHSGDQYEFNFVSYSNPKVDEMIESGLEECDTAKANETWKEMQRVIYEDQPYLFLYWMDEIVGVHERFQGTKIDVLSSIRDLYEWWVPPEKVKYKN